MNFSTWICHQSLYGSSFTLKPEIYTQTHMHTHKQSSQIKMELMKFFASTLAIPLASTLGEERTTLNTQSVQGKSKGEITYYIFNQKLEISHRK